MIRGFRNCWPLLAVLLACFYCKLSEARLHHHQKHSSAEVVGAVYCDTCFQDGMSKGSHYISGATVAVECAEGGSRPAFYQEVKTDKEGNFRVHLHFSVSKHVKKIEGCTVKLVKSSEPYCAVVSEATSSLIHLKERKRGKHVFSAGFFTLKPLKQPRLCNQQQSLTKSKLNSLGHLGSNPVTPVLPPIPTLPMPQIPAVPLIPSPLSPSLPVPGLQIPLPTVPDVPNVPQLPPLRPDQLRTVPKKPTEPSEGSKLKNDVVSRPQFFFFPPIPPVFGSPAGGLPIPNPFQPPTPPPSLLPPGIIPSLPPLPQLPPIPQVPWLAPPTPSPPPPASFLPPIRLPPGFPGLPPGFPGLPPAKPKKVSP